MIALGVGPLASLEASPSHPAAIAVTGIAWTHVGARCTGKGLKTTQILARGVPVAGMDTTVPQPPHRASRKHSAWASTPLGGHRGKLGASRRNGDTSGRSTGGRGARRADPPTPLAREALGRAAGVEQRRLGRRPRLARTSMRCACGARAVRGRGARVRWRTCSTRSPRRASR